MTLSDEHGATYKAIARNLREFGYPDVTPEMIQETHEAIDAGAADSGGDLPHGVVGMFAKGMLEDAGLLS